MHADKERLIIRAKTIAAMEGERRVHFLNPNAERIRKSLGDAVGLRHIGVHIVAIPPGRDSTEHHRHDFEEECVYVLSGMGTLTLDEESTRISAGDFIGFPTDGPAHSIHNSGQETLVCLIMGQRLEHDVADYPRQGKRLYRNAGRWDLVDVTAIVDPRSP